VPHSPDSVPAYTKWPSFPFEGDLRVKKLADPVASEPRRKGEDAADCVACNSPDDAYIWVSERWRVRAMERPTGLPMVLILEARSHLDLGDLPNLLAAELGVMTVRLERAVRSLDGVARVHVNRWGDSSAHLHMWFLARPYGQLQLRGTFLSLWDDILPPIAESVWRENLALVAAWLAEFGGTPLAEPPHIEWQAPSSLTPQSAPSAAAATAETSNEPLSVAIAEAPEGTQTGDEPAPAGPADTPAPNGGAVKDGSAVPTQKAAPEVEGVARQAEGAALGAQLAAAGDRVEVGGPVGPRSASNEGADGSPPVVVAGSAKSSES
jgi:hypothetical protein